MTPTPTQLTHWKQEIARLLPEEVFIVNDTDIYWLKTSSYPFQWRPVLDTELLQLIQWIEKKMSAKEKSDYMIAVWNSPLFLSRFEQQCATFPQRCLALEAAEIFNKL